MSTTQEGFVVSARKYRPMSWDEVIGQESITETLLNSIQQDHLAHAYLFCGPRGVGKTTCARIFAKEINRTEEHAEEEDFSFNIFELDAASNNSVDDIRSLTDQVRIPPQTGEYKVYIIDEVHMLSKQAFNAFLKTLEEPPKHAIFILATTEKHKIIPTILSRCQIYDFNRISVEEMVKQLTMIAEKENIAFEEEALHVIGQKADGAMRDALSIFDQLSNFTNANLTYDAVLKNLHVLDYDYYFKVTDYLYQESYAECLVVLDNILKQGFDGHHFISGLGSHFRDLLVCKDPRTLNLLEVGQSVKAKYAEQAAGIDSNWLIDGLKIISEAEFKYKGSSNQRLLLEVAMLNLASLTQKKKSSPDVTLLREPAKKLAVNQPKPANTPKTESPQAKEAPAPVIKPETEKPTQIVSEPEVKFETPTTEAPPPPASAPRDKKRRSSLTVSLNPNAPKTESIQEVMEKKEVETSTSETPGLTFEEAYSKMSQEWSNEGNKALFGILSKQNLEEQFKENKLTVKLSHTVEEDEFTLHKTELLQRLRDLTGNSELSFHVVREEIKTETKLFSAKDKFIHLNEKNPHLDKLRSEFDLDISF